MPEIVLINPGYSEKNEWSDDESLTEDSVAKTTKLAQIIVTLVNDGNVAIFSSSEGGARESAVIIGETMGVEPEYLGHCCQEDIDMDDIMTVLDLISQYEITMNTIIFIIDCPFLLVLLQQIFRLYANSDTDIGEIEVNCALFLNFEGEPSFLVKPDDDIYAEE